MQVCLISCKRISIKQHNSISQVLLLTGTTATEQHLMMLQQQAMNSSSNHKYALLPVLFAALQVLVMQAACQSVSLPTIRA